MLGQNQGRDNVTPAQRAKEAYEAGLFSSENPYQPDNIFWAEWLYEFCELLEYWAVCGGYNGPWLDDNPHAIDEYLWPDYMAGYVVALEKWCEERIAE
jgi:hypothetical protein